MSLFDNFVSVRCASCDVVFGMTATLHENRKSDGKSFFCTNGHSLSYGDTEADKLRRERDRLKQQVAERDDRIQRAIQREEAALRQRNAARGQVTKIKNRVGHGVCPCCNRTFSDLARHMNSKHPTYAAEAAE